jgi:predicted DNA-binding transcriptional regulator YafY
LTALPSLYEQSAKQFQNRIYIDPVAWWHSEQTRTHLNTIQDAVYKNRSIEMDYQRHDGNSFTRIVHPYGLVAKASVWYLIAAHEDGFRTYRISRISRVLVSEESFIRDGEFNLTEYWQTSTSNFLENVPFFTFTLAIHPNAKNMATWYSPGFCELEGVNENGWYIGQYYVDSLELAAMFVVGLGKQVIIIEPDELQAAVTEKIKALTAPE